MGEIEIAQKLGVSQKQIRDMLMIVRRHSGVFWGWMSASQLFLHSLVSCLTAVGLYVDCDF